MSKYDILQLPNAENCLCRIVDYWDADKEGNVTCLTISVWNPLIPTQKLWIRFYAMQYLEAPFRWQGANFREANFDEAYGLWKQLNPESPETLLKKQIERWKIYIIETPTFKIKILSLGHAISEEEPT